MSSILRALRRLESDAQSDQEPALDADVTIAPQAPVSDKARRLALALGAAFFLLASVLWLLLNRPSDSEETTAPAIEATRNAARARAPAEEVPRATASPPSPAPRREAPVRAEAAAALHRRPVAVIQAPPAAPAPKATPQPAPAAPTAAVRAEDAAPEKEKGRDVAAPAPPSEVQKAEARGPAPLGISRIVWHPNAEIRRAWVKISGDAKAQKVAEGDDVGNYRVERIDAASVLFRSGSTEVRRKLGE